MVCICNIGVELNERDNDFYLEVLYKPLLLTEKLLEWISIKTDISLNMLKTNGESYVEKFYSGNFEDYHFHIQLGKFISLKDIINPSNNLYNKQTDSVTIEAKIKIID